MDFLERFDERDRDRLLAAATTVRLGRGELLLRRGERGGDLFRVAEGELEVVDARSQPVVVLDVIARGGVVGEMSFLEDSVRSADVRAPEGAICQRWDRGQLVRMLDQEPAIAAAFYRVLAEMLAERQRSVQSSALSGAIGGSAIPRGPTNEVAAADGRALADALQARLMALEPLLRRDRPAAEHQITAELRNFEAAFGEALARMSEEDGTLAGRIVARELHPYTMRSHLGELALDREAGGAGALAVMAHVLANHPEGDGPLGAVLDAWLLALPTSRGFRERGALAVQLVLDALPPEPPLRLLAVNAAGGLVPALVERIRGRMAGEITCVDGDRAALAAVEGSVGARSKDLRLRLFQEDLVAVCLGRSGIRHAPQHVVVLDGLLEYLPERAGAAVLRWARGLCAPGGTVVATAVSPGADDPVYRHLLGWPMVRRRGPALARLLEGAGFTEAKVYEVGVTGLVAVAR